MTFEPNAVYPISALQKNQHEVREAAKQKLLRITENGASAYVFCSEDVLDRTIREAVEQALYEQTSLQAYEQGERDIAEGRCIEGAEALRDALGRNSAAMA